MKKTLLLLIAAFWLTGKTVAQRASEINVQASTLFQKLQDEDHSSSDKYNRSFQLNLQFTQPIFKRMYIETALNFTKRVDRSRFRSFYCCCFGPCPEYYSGNPIVASYIGAELALRHQFLTLNKWSMYASAGMAAAYNIKLRRTNNRETQEEKPPQMLSSFSRMAVRYTFCRKLHADVIVQGRYDLSKQESVYKKWHTGIGIGIGINI